MWISFNRCKSRIQEISHKYLTIFKSKQTFPKSSSTMMSQQAVIAFFMVAMPSVTGHGLMNYPPSRNQLCGVEIKPHQSAGTYCEDAFEIDFTGGYSFMSVLTHDIGRTGSKSTHVCGFDSETWYGGATPWDTPTDAWPTFPMEPGVNEFWWNIEWGPHFDDTDEFRYWITKEDFVWDPTRELTWDDFDDEAFCILFYDDKNPGANPNVVSIKDDTEFRTFCEVPTRMSGHHVIYGEWGRNHYTYERFHGCIDVEFGSGVPTSPVATPTAAPVTPTASPVSPTAAPVAAPTDMPVTPTALPVATPTDAPVASPTDMPVVAPTDMPVASPTNKPVASPVAATCGTEWADCYKDNNSCCDGYYCDTYTWYAQCRRSSTEPACLTAYQGCASNPDGCCEGLTCKGEYWLSCQA